VETGIPGLTIIRNYITPEEHDMMLQLALEERENAARGTENKKYDHNVLTTQYIPTINLYMLYKSIFQRLIETDKVCVKEKSENNKRSFRMLLSS
jgi:hypothetical protein